MPGRGFADPEHRAKHANLKGRPLGAGGWIGKAIRAHEDDIPAVMDRIFQLALDEDPSVATPHLHFIGSRCWPIPKPTDHVVQFPLPENIRPGDLDGLTLAVLRAVSSGQLDPTSGAKLCSALTAHLSMTSTKDMQRLGERLAEIERVMQGRPTLNAAPANDPVVEAWPLKDGDPTSTLDIQ
jgi:hypothetical protein